MAAFKYENNIFVCYLFNDKYVKLNLDIEMLRQKYLFHKYECYKLSNEQDTYDTYELNIKSIYPDGYEVEPYRC